MKRILLSAALLLGTLVLPAQNLLDLSGQWDFKIDRRDRGEKERWYAAPLRDDRISLPGSMPEKLKGDDVSADTRWTGSLYDSSYYYNPYMERYRRAGNVKFPFFLTPDKHYVGVAWYQREIVIPKTWAGRRITLLLERPHIETTVWLGNTRIGMQNSLCVPHVYELGGTAGLRPGKYLLTIRVDNRIKEINVGPDSHSITDQTQGNWNGIVGRIALQATPRICVADVQVYPDVTRRQAVVKLRLQGKGKSMVALRAESFNGERRHVVELPAHTVQAEDSVHTFTLDMGREMLLWDEFSPTLYRLTVSVGKGPQIQQVETEFGMRSFEIRGKWFYVNGRKVQLRGTVENCDFPLTGYAPMDVESWERVFRRCREYGLNHMRFHSFCPPEAAFRAADRVGFYLQPEGPSWPNHGPRLGQGQPIDRYLMDETIALTRAYGNHPSFCMLACGNEPAGRWVPWVTRFVEYWKQADPRRVYTGASVGNSWKWQPANEFHVKAGARGLTWDTLQPATLDDYRLQNRIDTVRQPYVAHEMGQWCVFPNFDETVKYTGVNKAKNFEIFRDILRANQMESLAHRFVMASGKLQALCYKYEIEKMLRTPDYAGFQLLALNDYSGQGTALVGVTDVFFDAKEYINAQEWRRFCSPTVPLMRTKKFVYENNERFCAAIEVAHFGSKPLGAATVSYTLKDGDGKLYDHGVLGAHDLVIGNLQRVGEIEFPLMGITRPTRLNLEVRIGGTEAVNDWNIWVYPAKPKIDQGTVYVTDTLDAKALAVLQDGGNVLIAAAGRIRYGREVVQHFTPVFWNTSWFKMRPPHTTGILVNPNHPLFREFPTEYHSDLQWWELLNKAQVMQFTRFPREFQPTVQSIDTWFISRKIGTLFEARVLNGKLLMTSMDISSDLDGRIVARQLRKAILDYMNSEAFRPAWHVTPGQVSELFTRVAGAVKVYTEEAPDELKPTVL
ncbi:MAG: beta-glucuronidase [Prevotellaceae bacterium]|jgi:hypothetical protein|nr:beta-glucuronidase [Prevotellaceae bacterium]